MPTNKNASILYQALDKSFGRTNKKYFIEEGASQTYDTPS